MNSSGKQLGKTMKALGKELDEIADQNNVLNKEQLNEFLRTFIEDMNSELKEGFGVSQTGFNIILLGLANYSLIESQIYKKSGLKLNKEVRKNILSKAFLAMAQGMEEDLTMPEVKEESESLVQLKTKKSV